MSIISTLYLEDTALTEGITDEACSTIAVAVTATRFFTDSLETRGERRTVAVGSTLTVEDTYPSNALFTDRAESAGTTLLSGHTQEVCASLCAWTLGIILALSGENTLTLNTARARTTIYICDTLAERCTDKVFTSEVNRAVPRESTFSGKETSACSTALTQTTVIITLTAIVRNTGSIDTSLTTWTRIIWPTSPIENTGKVDTNERRLTV